MLKLIKSVIAIRPKRYLRLRIFADGIIIGLFTGVVVGLFRYLLALSEIYRPMIYEFVKNEPEMIFPYMLYFAGAAIVLAIIVRKEPMCTGSGIPQLKGVLAGQMNWNWFSVIMHKLAGGVIAIGSGMSLGREGPSVQLGACAGNGISRMYHRPGIEEKVLITAGAGAGLAAAFNAPLAGVIFCLEELQKLFSPLLLTAAIAAAVVATSVTQLVFGGGPVFHINDLSVVPLEHFGYIIGLGLFVGVLSRCFNPCLLFSLNAYDRSGLKGMSKPMLPLAVAAVLGFVLPEILGGGNLLVDELVASDYALSLLVIIFLGKFLFTMLCFGSGVPGGIFLPMLVLGAAGGAIYGKLLIISGIMPENLLPTMIVFGMAAYFSSVVKSPVTGSILIMEMTGSFHHMLPLICVAMAAYMVADITGGRPVYDELLDRSLKAQK